MESMTSEIERLMKEHGDKLGENVLGYPTSWIHTRKELATLKDALRRKDRNHG